MGKTKNHEQLCCEVRLNEHVPADHLLRRIDAVLDLSFVRPLLAPSYSSRGRPSVDPELMLRMLLIGYLTASGPGAGSARTPASTWPTVGSAAWACMAPCRTTRRSQKTAMAASASAACSGLCSSRWSNAASRPGWSLARTWPWTPVSSRPTRAQRGASRATRRLRTGATGMPPAVRCASTWMRWGRPCRPPPTNRSRASRSTCPKPTRRRAGPTSTAPASSPTRPTT